MHQRSLSALSRSVMYLFRGLCIRLTSPSFALVSVCLTLGASIFFFIYMIGLVLAQIFSHLSQHRLFVSVLRDCEQIEVKTLNLSRRLVTWDGDQHGKCLPFGLLHHCPVRYQSISWKFFNLLLSCGYGPQPHGFPGEAHSPQPCKDKSSLVVVWDTLVVRVLFLFCRSPRRIPSCISFDVYKCIGVSMPCVLLWWAGL